MNTNKLLKELLEYAKANPNAKELQVAGKIRMKRFQDKEVIEIRESVFDRWRVYE